MIIRPFQGLVAAISASVLCAFLLDACVTPPKPLVDKSELGEIGFRFQPPVTPGWYIHEPPGVTGFFYAKEIEGLPLRSPKHSVIFAAQYGFLDLGSKTPRETLEKVRAEKDSQAMGPRFISKKNQSKLRQFHGASCLEFDSLAHDKTANQEMTLIGMFCLHPNDARRYVDLSYSQRYDGDRQPLVLEKEGRAFVESIRFLPLK